MYDFRALTALDISNSKLTAEDAKRAAEILKVQQDIFALPALTLTHGLLLQANSNLKTLAISNNDLTNYGGDLDGVIALTEAVAAHVSALG